ncbi:MAG: hypothetical protein JO086_15285 [Acidimicrobiia bacterium]|nr:hypothetical protein [Acidimicrobiia bacterium]
MRRALLAVVVGLAFVVPAAPALAQTSGGSGTPTVVSCGSATTGGTISCNIGGFPAGATVTVFVNGTGGLTKTADGSGVIHVTIQITSQTAGLLGDPVNVTLVCGTNTITATGGGVTQSGTFTNNCPAATPVAAAPTSNVAFTGANILRWTLAAAALLGIGALMVWGSRRRRPTLDD